MRQFFIIIFAFVLGGCNSAKDISGVYHLISDDPALKRVTLEIDEAKAPAIDFLDQLRTQIQVRTTFK